MAEYTITERNLQAAEREYEHNLCKRQGRLFALASRQGYDCERFTAEFMHSFIAAGLDSEYNRYQWAGEEYLLEEIISSNAGAGIERNTGKSVDENVMYWIGYIYRYWHFYKNVSSQKIYRIAPFKRMQTNYLYFHSMAPELAIDDLIEIYEQHKASQAKNLLGKYESFDR